MLEGRKGDGIREGERTLRARPGGERQQRAPDQPPPDLLGDEGHEGVEKLQGKGQDFFHHPASQSPRTLIPPGKLELGGLEVAVAEGVPEEIVEGEGGLVEVETAEILGHRANRLLGPSQDSAVLERKEGSGPGTVGGKTLLSLDLGGDETRGVPDLVGEVSPQLAESIGIVNVLPDGGEAGDGKAERVRPVVPDDVEGIGGIAERLRHFASLEVPYQARKVYITERDFLVVPGAWCAIRHRDISHHFRASHDHSRHPEENDIRCGHQCVGRVKIPEIGVVVWPAEC